MNRNKYSHIKSFSDFDHEKMRLFYEIRLAEKKLEIRKLELKEYITPVKFLRVIFNELAKPVFGLLKSFIEGFVEGNKQGKSGKKKQKKSSETSSKEQDETEE